MPVMGRSVPTATLAMTPQNSNPTDSRQRRRYGLCLVLPVVLLCACSRTAPMHVWQPAVVGVTPHSTIALGPIAGQRELAEKIEFGLLSQRPQARADLAIFMPDQLAERSAVRLASTAELASDISALAAARSVGADVLLQGEIVASDVDMEFDEPQPQPDKINYNELFFKKKSNGDTQPETLLLSWRVIDVVSGQTLGTHVFNTNTRIASEEYPDLEVAHADATDLLVAASARETWKAIAPSVEKTRVKLAVPWLQPGAMRTRWGVWAARKGNWKRAEEHWEKATHWFWFNNAAHHNLALAKVASEDFPAANEHIEKAGGFFAFTLPNETLFWIDSHQRLFHEAHGLPAPPSPWTFTRPIAEIPVESVEPIDIEDLPWWTAIPFTKPPS